MLTRMAESLFWVGRYTERADDTARILDVALHNVLEGSPVDPTVILGDLCQTMGMRTPPEGLSPSSVTEALAYDPAQPSSIVSSVRAAREAAKGVRQAISAELWECLNATHFGMEPKVSAARSMGPHLLFRYVKERAAMAAGLADSTMSRDGSWHFLVLGRSLERVDMTARLLLSSYRGTGGSPDWATTLRCCSAHEAYLKAYQRPPQARSAVEFLLSDRRFPRSVFHALSSAESTVSSIVSPKGPAGARDPALRILGRMRAWLEFSDVDELMEDLPGALGSLQEACAGASDSLWAKLYRSSGVSARSGQGSAAAPVGSSRAMHWERIDGGRPDADVVHQPETEPEMSS